MHHRNHFPMCFAFDKTECFLHVDLRYFHKNELKPESAWTKAVADKKPCVILSQVTPAPYQKPLLPQGYTTSENKLNYTFNLLYESHANTNTIWLFKVKKKSCWVKNRNDTTHIQRQTQSHIKITLTANLLLKCTQTRQKLTQFWLLFRATVSSALSDFNCQDLNHVSLEINSTNQEKGIYMAFHLHVVCVSFNLFFFFKWRKWQKWQNNWIFCLFGTFTFMCYLSRCSSFQYTCFKI